MEPKSLKVYVDGVRIGKRIRKEPGDLAPLKESMQRFGLLHPIVIDSEFNLVAGFRRLNAARQLGWDVIDARMVELDGQEAHLVAELEENTTRIDFTAEQLGEAEKILSRYRKSGIFWNLINRLLG